jgi:hypothetical protein
VFEEVFKRVLAGGLKAGGGRTSDSESISSVSADICSGDDEAAFLSVSIRLQVKETSLDAEAGWKSLKKLYGRKTLT